MFRARNNLPGADTPLTIALCTRNGAAYLDAQLASYQAQSHAAWDLWVSDDGSTDATREILERWATRWQGVHAVHVLDGPGRGATANFMALLTHPGLPADRPLALSDQDDVWLPHKLERALAQIGTAAGPVLYGAQSRHVDAALVPIGHSRPPRRGIGFVNALAQNVVSGHTAMLNPAALRLARRAGAQEVAHHDWWLYLLISGAGGQVVIDREEVLLYRQHGGNEIGARQGVRAGLGRAGRLADGTYQRWFRANLEALQAARALLTPDNRALVADLIAMQAQPGPARARILRRAGLYRQGRADTLALRLAALLGRL